MKKWVVALHPNGKWTVGGVAEELHKSGCAVWVIYALKRREAKQRAQIRNAELKRSGALLVKVEERENLEKMK